MIIKTLIYINLPLLLYILKNKILLTMASVGQKKINFATKVMDIFT